MKNLYYKAVDEEGREVTRVSRQTIWTVVAGAVGIAIIAVLLLAVLLLSIFLGIAENRSSDSNNNNNNNNAQPEQTSTFGAVAPLPSSFCANVQVSGPNIPTHNKQWFFDSTQQREAFIIPLPGKNGPTTVKIIKDTADAVKGVQYLFNQDSSYCFPLPAQNDRTFVGQTATPSGTWTNPSTGKVCDMTTVQRADGSEFIYAKDPVTGALCYLEEPGFTSITFSSFSTDSSCASGAVDYTIPTACRQLPTMNPRDARWNGCSACKTTVNDLIAAGAGAISAFACGIVSAGTAAAVCGVLVGALADGACSGAGCGSWVCGQVGEC